MPSMLGPLLTEPQGISKSICVSKVVDAKEVVVWEMTQLSKVFINFSGMTNNTSSVPLLQFHEEK